MARPSDRWVLNLDHDPTPEVPGRIDTTVVRFDDDADMVRRGYRSVTPMRGDGAVPTWVGLVCVLSQIP